MWEQAALACESALRVTPREEPPRWYFVATLAEAHLHLGDWSAAADDIARMRAWGEDDWADMHAVGGVARLESLARGCQVRERPAPRSTRSGRPLRGGPAEPPGELAVHREVGAADQDDVAVTSTSAWVVRHPIPQSQSVGGLRQQAVQSWEKQT